MRASLLLTCAALGLAACANLPAGEPDAASVEPVRSSAVLFVEQAARARGADEAAERVHVGARFVQFTGVDATALPDLLGLPLASARVEAGCVERGEASVDGARAEVRLLDVGPLEVRAGERAVTLQPRRFPDLWNVVSGVLYAADEELDGDEALWRFSAGGGAAARVPAFEVDARAPAPLAQLALNEQAFGPDATVSLPARRPLALRWLRGDRDDIVAAVFEGTNAERPVRVVCSARDEGALELDGAWSERLARLGRGGATVTVHRLRVRPFALAGIEQASVVFDRSVRAHLTATAGE